MDKGGALFVGGTARVMLSDETLLRANQATPGSQSVWLAAGEFVYRLPAPLGRYVDDCELTGEVRPIVEESGLSDDYPRPCAPGLIGDDNQTATQSVPGCAGLCPAGST